MRSSISALPVLGIQLRCCALGTKVAGDEKGLVASFTNMTKALRSLGPLLDTCIGVLGGCPGMD